MILQALASLSALAALVVTAAYFGGTNRVSLWVSQGLVLISAVLAAIILLNPKAARSARLPARTEWSGPILLYSAFLIFGVVQLALTVLSEGHWGTVNRHATLEALVRHLVFGAAVFAFTVAITSRAYVRLVALSMALFVLGSGSASFYLKINGLVGGTHNNVSTLAYFGANSNQYGGFLTALTPLFLGIVVYRLTRGGIFRGRRLDPDGLEALFLAGTVALLTAVVFWVEARGAFVMHMLLMAGCAAHLVFRARFKLVLILLTVALAAGAIILHVLGSAQAAEWFGRSLSESLSSRISTQTDVYRGWVARPWFGWGDGTLPWILRSLQTSRSDMVFVLQSYNAHLTRLAESGLVGAVLWYGAIFTWCVPSAVKALRSPSLWSSCMGAASAVGVLYLGFLCLTDDYTATPATSLVLALYLAILIRTRHPLSRSLRSQGEPEDADDDEAEVGRNRPARSALGLAVIVLAAVAGWLSFADQQASKELDRAGVRPLIRAGLAFPVKTDEIVLGALRQASAATPWAADPPALRGRYWQSLAYTHKDDTLRRAQLEEALKEYRSAIRYAPTWPDTYLYAASVCIALKYREEAAALFLEGLRHNPNSRDQKLYALSALLVEAERTRWPDERSELLAACRRIVEGASHLQRPLTLHDYNYASDYDHMAGKPRKLPAEDERRVRTYLESLTIEGKRT